MKDSRRRTTEPRTRRAEERQKDYKSIIKTKRTKKNLVFFLAYFWEILQKDVIF